MHFDQYARMSYGLPRKAPAKRAWVSLTSALTWVHLDYAFELPELLEHAVLHEWWLDDVRQSMEREWHELSDYACRQKLDLRAWNEVSGRNVQLNEDNLKNFTHLGWLEQESPRLALDRFPVTFAGAFKKRARKIEEGFLDPEVRRSHLETYKRVRARKRQKRLDRTVYAEAREWLKAELSGRVPQTGLRLALIERIVRRFDLKAYQAQQIYTEVTRDLGWPKGGRYPKSLKKSVMEISRNENF